MCAHRSHARARYFEHFRQNAYSTGTTGTTGGTGAGTWTGTIVLALASYLYRKRYALLMCVHELVITGGMSSPAANVSVTSVRVIRAGEESVSTA